jgi:hypothetical protein
LIPGYSVNNVDHWKTIYNTWTSYVEKRGDKSWEKKTLSEQSKIRSKIVEIDIPNTHTYDRSLSLLCTDTSIKHGGLN